MYKCEIYKNSKIWKNINLNKCTIKGHKDKGRIRLLDKSPCVKVTYFYPSAITVITGHSLHAYIQVQSKVPTFTYSATFNIEEKIIVITQDVVSYINANVHRCLTLKKSILNVSRI